MSVGKSVGWIVCHNFQKMQYIEALVFMYVCMYVVSGGGRREE